MMIKQTHYIIIKNQKVQVNNSSIKEWIIKILNVSISKNLKPSCVWMYLIFPITFWKILIDGT